MKYSQQITLKHLLIENKKCIGLQFYSNKVINALIKELNGITWDEEFNMYYMPNNKVNLDKISVVE